MSTKTAGTTTTPSVSTGPTTAQPTTGGTTTSQAQPTTECAISMVDDTNIEDIYTVTAPSNPLEENPVDASTVAGFQPTTGSTTLNLTLTPTPNADVEGVDYVKFDVDDAESVTINYFDGDEPKSVTLVSTFYISNLKTSSIQRILDV